jgi:hypothetical protein
VLTPTGVGTIVEEGKQKVQLGGKTFLLETALRADFALIHASPGSHHSRATYPLSRNQRMTHECARQSHVSALARDDHPFSSVRYQGPHAQSRAGTYDSIGPAASRVLGPTGHTSVSGAIADDLQRAQFKASMQITGRKLLAQICDP